MHATTIHLERDGSGDYDALQPAIDSAAPGDTILIGPGRYDQYVQYPSPFDTLDAIARVATPNLTFRGTSRDEVIVGPEVRPNSTPYRGSTCFYLDSTTGIRIESMRIENAYTGISSDAELQLYDILLRGHENTAVGNHSVYPLIVDGCLVEENLIGLLLRAGDVGTRISNSNFVNNSDKAITAALGANFEVRECSFAPPSEEDFAFAILLDRSSKAHIVNCQFQTGGAWSAIGIGQSSVAVVDSCHFGTGRANIALGSAGRVTGRGNVLEGGTLGTLYFEDQSSASFAGNDIRHFTGPSVLIQTYSVLGQANIDLRDNYWGTDSADSISAWIHDAQDDPNLAPTVLFEPFRTQSVPVGEKSVGGLKALFRGRQ